MTKEEFELEYKSLSKKFDELYVFLTKKYEKVIYGTDPTAKSRFGNDFHIYEEMMKLGKECNNLSNEYYNAELKSEQFYYSDARLDASVAIEVHDILLEKGFYKEHLDINEDFDYVKVIYNCLYNDNWNDLFVAKLQLFKDRSKLLREIVIFDESLYENSDEETNEDESLYYKKEPLEIEMYDCKIYSFNEAYQSFVISKEKCKLN